MAAKKNSSKEKTAALLLGITCHTLFALAIVSAITAQYQGMHLGLIRLPLHVGSLLDLLLLLQFPLVHSLLLTRDGSRRLAGLAPEPWGRTLCTTSFTVIASLQMMALYLLWTPLGPVWWEAQGLARVSISLVYLSSWFFLGRTMYDAGLAVQTGFLGWSSMFRGVAPDYGEMPERGTFRFVRQPVYLAFALTVWTVPTWTPDQLILALWFTAYCLLGPLLKERRYARRYGQKFESYRERTPYFIPRLR